MSEIIVSSSSNSDKREIDEYHDESRSNGSSSNSNSNSSGGNTTDKQYLSRILGVPLEVLQEEMRMRMAFRSLSGTSISAPRLPL